MIKRWFAAAAIVALAACGGAHSGGVVPSAPTASPTASSSPGAGSGASDTDSVAFSITIPPASATSTARRPLYTSPNTGSVAIVLESVNGVAQSSVTPTIAAVGPSASGCSSGSSGVTCKTTATAPAGDDLFEISTYQSNNGTGAVLASTALAISVGATASSVALTLGGVPASLSFSPAHLPLLNNGTIQRVPVTLNAADASGALIVGSAAYQSPVSLQIENDPAGALSLSTTSVAQPGTVVTVTYNAAKTLSEGEIVASDNGMKQSTLIAAPLTIAPSSLTVFDTATSGNIALTEGGFTGTFTATVANAADASVSVLPGTVGSGSAGLQVTPKTHFDVTSIAVSDGYNTTSVPLAIVPQNGTYTEYGSKFQMHSPTNMVQDASGNFWSSDLSTGSLVKFTPSNGTYTEYQVDPTDQGPYGIALDSSGNVWYADGPQIGEFTPSTQSNVSYSAGFTAASPWVTDIVAGANGTMWFYDINSPGNTLDLGNAPTYVGSISTSTGAITEYVTPNDAGPTEGKMSMVLGKDGSLWFADQFNESIAHVNTSNGAITEYSLGTPAMPAQAPMALAVTPDGKIWFGSDPRVIGLTASSSGWLVGYIDPSNDDAISYDTNLSVPSYFEALGVGSDGNLWFVAGQNALESTANVTFGVINPSTGAIYEYPTAIFPQNADITTIIPGTSGTLWTLDAGFGQIGETTFK